MLHTSLTEDQGATERGKLFQNVVNRKITSIQNMLKLKLKVGRDLRSSISDVIVCNK